MKLVWLPKNVSTLAQQPPVDPPRWTRMEKLTAASITLGVVGLLISMYRRSQ